MSSFLVLLLSLALAVGIVAVSTRTEVETIEIGDCPECCVTNPCPGLPHAPSTLHGILTIGSATFHVTLDWSPGNTLWSGTACCTFLNESEQEQEECYEFFVTCPAFDEETQQYGQPLFSYKLAGQVSFFIINEPMTVDSQDPVHLSASGTLMGTWGGCGLPVDDYPWTFVVTE